MNVHIDDVTAFILEYLSNPADGGYSNYGYEVYLPNVIPEFIKRIEGAQMHRSDIYNGPRVRELSPLFYEAAWNLCRQGILRPGIRQIGLQATEDGASGNGYTVTEAGRRWLESGTPAFVLLQPDRLGTLFQKLAIRGGPGFLQRAIEAAYCHSFGAYLACCALCGAAAESILLAVAIAKLKDENAVLTSYRASHGRRKIIDAIVGKAKPSIADPFRSATGLLTYWRDEAAHGLASTISEAEAHDALSRLLRFAQFVTDNWAALVSP